MYWYGAIMLTSAAGIASTLLWRFFEIRKGNAPVADESAPLFSLKELKSLLMPHVSRHRETMEKGARYTASHCIRLGGVCIATLRDTMVERRLVKLIDAVRGRQDIEDGGVPSSSFLRSVILHKQKLREQTEKSG